MPNTLHRRALAVFGIIISAAFFCLNPAAAEEASKPAAAKPDAKDTKDCLSYEPGVVMLQGKLQHPVESWVLQLDNPVCINARDNETTLYPQMDNVKTVIFELRKSDQAGRYDAFTNKDVMVTGTLYHENYGADSGSVRMLVSDIDVAKDVNNGK